MSEEQQKIQQLTYALGLAIGALESIKINPHDFSKEGCEGVLQQLKEIAGLVCFHGEFPPAQGDNE